MEKLGLKAQTLKVAMLFALVTAQRCQTLDMLQINFTRDTSSSLEFVLPYLIKQNRPVIVRRQSLSKHSLVASQSLLIHTL